jgi:hypothetical protein
MSHLQAYFERRGKTKELKIMNDTNSEISSILSELSDFNIAWL